MLPVRGATRCSWLGRQRANISIHAPRAGSDLRARPPAPDAGNFNPCSPCGERQIPHVFHGTHPRFQSMLPVRGATVICFSRVLCFFISIHAPRAGSDPRPFEASAPAQKFQSMLPVRGATGIFIGHLNVKVFQSMLPVRGATLRQGRGDPVGVISIHAPRAGSDPVKPL